VSPSELGWNTTELDTLLNYLQDNHTRGFVILYKGEIVVEVYFGNNVLGTAPFTRESQWYWASAGKTLTATLAGIAQQEGHLDITQPTSNYLGSGWTSLSPDKENAITVEHQLTMTTGLYYDVSDLDCTLPSCLTYRADGGQQWYYHNAPYTLVHEVVESATGIEYNLYTDQRIESVTGMSGEWVELGYNTTYWSTARDMARFGLLILNEGKWEHTQVLSDINYYNQMVNTSQSLNPAYGYLWWLNGKDSIILPSLPTSFNLPLSQHAPEDMYAGMGKNGQFVNIVPSLDLVVVRMGEAPDGALVPIVFHDEMWKMLQLVIGY
jgi:CubicO group peptidase (beta-lactamase class C family)